MKKRITDINDEVIKEQLKNLEEYFGEPVLPMSEYCSAFEKWANCIVKANTDPDLKKNGGYAQGSSYYKHLHSIMTDIRKSNLLGRLLYGKEKFRTKICPVHKGHWNGQTMLMGDCPHNCDGTGWLREE